MGSNYANGDADSMKPTVLSSSPSFKARKKSSNFPTARAGSDVDDIITLLHGSDPVRVELNRLDNDLRDKDRELGDAIAEIKSLKNSERLKEKAVEELRDELKKVDEKLKATEAHLDSKNLELKKINGEKREAMAAQFAAEATLRRVHAAQKDDEMPPIEAILAPLEAELKLARLEAAKLQEDNRALDRLTKSKEAALIDAEKTVQVALAKASLVDDLQNRNQELMKQIEICQEENKILDKMLRQKVAEVEKMTQTVRELEEAVLAGGAAANAVRDYQRKVQEINEERKTLEREVARAKVSANRVATVIANEWKDGNDKVMPVKQWLEERRIFQGEIQQIRDKLAVAERTAKAEAQLKEKFQLRFKVLEERLKASNVNSRAALEARSTGNGLSRSKSIRSNSANLLLKQAKRASKSFDGVCRSLDQDKTISDQSRTDNVPGSIGDEDQSANGNVVESTKTGNEDLVSGTLYDLLQKEVISLRKACHEKDQNLKDKDDAIEMLGKKVDTLNKSMEVEAKKMRREVAAMEKEVAAIRGCKEHDPRMRRMSVARGAVNC